MAVSLAVETASMTRPASWKLSVVIPAYNEEDGICAILERVLSMRARLQQVGVESLEVVVVDDGSRDKTPELVGRYPDVRLIRHHTNHGYGAALKTGFFQATGDLLAFLDADGTYPPEHLPDLCQKAMNGADLVIGSRMAGAQSDMPRVRRLGNVLFASLVTLVGAQRVSDSASGMRVFHRRVLDKIYPLPDGLNFTPVMTTRALHEDVTMAEVAIPYSERLGDSKLSVVRDGVRFLNSIVWTALSYNPVRVLGMVSMVALALALLLIGGVTVLRLQGVTHLGPWGVFAVYATLVLSVTGVSLLNLGTMFNYLVALVQRRRIRQEGLLGRRLFSPALHHQFWWMGLLAVGVGLLVGVVSLALSFRGWDMTRLWLWLLGSAMLILTGVQFVISWMVAEVLEDVSQRDSQVVHDLQSER